ncbi:MAG: peptidylprolyl isomerase [Acidobacteriota bacterium]
MKIQIVGVVALSAIAALIGWAVINRLSDQQPIDEERTEERGSPAPVTIPQNVVEAIGNVPKEIKPIDKVIRVTLQTSMGDITVELHGPDAPKTVGNFLKLAQLNLYDGTSFHRVIQGFMIQGGDPLSGSQELRPYHGAGGVPYTFEDEINSRPLVRGSVAMANSGPNTNSSQFFIVTADSVPHLNGLHTNFGTVIAGMDVVDAISQVQVDERDNPVQPVVLEDVIILP